MAKNSFSSYWWLGDINFNFLFWVSWLGDVNFDFFFWVSWLGDINFDFLFWVSSQEENRNRNLVNNDNDGFYAIQCMIAKAM